MPVEIKQSVKNHRKEIQMSSVTGILEGNVLIAEFMGGKEVDWFAERVVLIPHEHQAHLGLPQIISMQNYHTWAKSYIVDMEVKYHSDWNWIMPVYLKAKEVIKSRQMRGRNNSGNLSRIIVHTGSNAVKDAGKLILEGKCLEASEKLVEAIKWHNKHKDK